MSSWSGWSDFTTTVKPQLAEKGKRTLVTKTATDGTNCGRARFIRAAPPRPCGCVTLVVSRHAPVAVSPSRFPATPLWLRYPRGFPPRPCGCHPRGFPPRPCGCVTLVFPLGLSALKTRASLRIATRRVCGCESIDTFEISRLVGQSDFAIFHAMYSI